MRTFRRLALPPLVSLLALPAVAGAQHSFSTQGQAYDARVPTPKSVLGYDIGDRFTPHHMLMRYVERVAAASPRVRVDTMGRSVEGRELLLIAVTSEANVARLDRIRADARRLADPRGAAAAELADIARRLPAIVWLEHSVHGGEASGFESAMALLYQLAAGTDAETRLALDSTVVLIDPSENPDGHERHVHDVQRALSVNGPVPSTPGALVHQGSWPGPRGSHYGFDLNRDWFIQSHPETRARVQAFMRWWPHVAVDLHEMGSSSSYYFAPPMEPDNKNNPPHLPKWFESFGKAHGAAFDVHGWSFFRREGYDSFYPGYGEAWPMLTGAVGMLFEVAASGGGNILRNDGTMRTLRDAAWQHYTAEWTTVRHSSRNAGAIVRDYAASRQANVGAWSGGVRAVAFARDGDGRADSLAARLRDNGIEVSRLAPGANVSGTPFGGGATGAARLDAGGYVVDYQQPQGRLARAILEPDAQLDSAFIRAELESRRTGLPNKFYDVTAWSLPYVYRVKAWELRALPAGLEAVTDAMVAPRAEVPDSASYGYAFAPGSEASLRLLASLLTDSVRVWYAQRAFTSGATRFPTGAFVVRAAANDARVHERVRRHARAAGARVVALASAGVDAGADLGSNSVLPIRRPSVALLAQAPVSGTSFGFAWYAIDQRLRYPVTTLDASAIAGTALDEFNVLVVPSVNGGALDSQLGDGGRARLAAWVRNGGVLIALDGASAWLAGERLGLARVRVKRDSTRADSTGGAPLRASVPGAIVRATVDTLSPLLAGVRDAELPVFVNTDRALTVPKDLTSGEAVVRYAPAARLRLSGYLWPESTTPRALTPYLWTERAGRGRVIAFTEDPNFRDLLRGLFPLFANAVLLGGSY